MKIKVSALKILIALTITVVMVFSLAACADDSVNKFSLPQVKEGETFKITLDAHGGTAYSWSYKISSNSGIEYVTQEYIPTDGDSDIIGGGQLKYTFKAVKAGNYKITFKLEIPWEATEATPIETNIYSITVAK